MPRGVPIDLKIRKEIMKRIAEGEKAPDLAGEFDVKVHQIHNWVYYAKKKRREQNKKSKLKAKTGTNTKPAKESTFDELVQKFKDDVKQLIIKETLESLAAFESAI